MKLKYKEFSSVFCCGCDSWSVAVMEDNRLFVLGSRVLGKMFGLEREEVKRNWGKVQSVRFCNLQPSPDTFNVITLKRMS